MMNKVLANTLSSLLSAIGWAIRCGALSAGLVVLPAAALASEPPPPFVTPEQHYGLALEAQTERDSVEMFRRLRSAAEGGHLPAQELLGVMLLNAALLLGNARAQDQCEAFVWFERAARQGGRLGATYLEVRNRQVRTGMLRGCVVARQGRPVMTSPP
jgi:hypothetical protein